MEATKNLDRAAAVLSLSCIAHCIALPVLAIALPFLAMAAEAEWVHWLLAAMAIVSSGTVVASAHSARTPSFLVPASIGMVLIVGALLAEPFGFDETPPTVIGGIFLAAAHLFRIFKHK